MLSLLFFWLHEAYSWLFSFLVFFWKRCHLTSFCVPSTWKVVYNFFFSFFFCGLGRGAGAIPLLEKGILGCVACWGIQDCNAFSSVNRFCPVVFHNAQQEKKKGLEPILRITDRHSNRTCFLYISHYLGPQTLQDRISETPTEKQLIALVKGVAYRCELEHEACLVLIFSSYSSI